MELAIIQGALALAVWSGAIYLFLTGRINKSIDFRKFLAKTKVGYIKKGKRWME